MSKNDIQGNKKSVLKRSSQGGSRPKTSTMNKHRRHGYKPNRGQGR